MAYDYTIQGADELITALERVGSTRVNSIVKSNITQMFNRAASNDPKSGGTPVAPSTKWHKGGHLRQSRAVTNDGKNSTFGYTASYAPHVEYGHRTVNGGYVPGQYFLRENKNRQEKIFIKDCSEELVRRMKKR